MAPRRAQQQHHAVNRRQCVNTRKEPLTNIIRYCMCGIMLLFACYYACRILFLATYIILQVSVAYFVHPCAWLKKESWRKRQMKKIHGFYKRIWCWKKDVSRIIRSIPVNSLFSWQFLRQQHDEETPTPVTEETPREHT